MLRYRGLFRTAAMVCTMLSVGRHVAEFIQQHIGDQLVLHVIN